jgi:hypothetical protein
MSVAALATVFAGFARPYYLSSYTGAPSLPLQVLVHAAVFTAWMVLLIVQTSLVAIGRRALHRRLGIFGVGLAMVTVVIGYMTAIAAARRGYNPNPFAPDSLAFLASPLGDLAVFVALTALGIYHRRDTETHKRLMLLGTVGALMLPALARLPYIPVSSVGLLVLFLLAGPAYDRWSLGCVHTVYKWASVPVFLTIPLRLVIGATDGWRAFAAWLVQ